MWYTGSYWMLGSIHELNQGKITFGFLQNDEIVDCPSYSAQWREWYRSSWDINHIIGMNCDGKWLWIQKIGNRYIEVSIGIFFWKKNISLHSCHFGTLQIVTVILDSCSITDALAGGIPDVPVTVGVLEPYISVSRFGQNVFQPKIFCSKRIFFAEKFGRKAFCTNIIKPVFEHPSFRWVGYLYC